MKTYHMRVETVSDTPICITDQKGEIIANINPPTEYPFQIIRNDMSIVCAAKTQKDAEEVMEALTLVNAARVLAKCSTPPLENSPIKELSNAAKELEDS